MVWFSLKPWTVAAKELSDDLDGSLAQLDQAFHAMSQSRPITVQEQQALQNQQAGTQGQSSSSIDNKTYMNNRALDLLYARLRGVNLNTPVLSSASDFLACHIAGTKVYTFFVFGDKVGHLEDDGNMFPSDELITKLRLIRS